MIGIEVNIVGDEILVELSGKLRRMTDIVQEKFEPLITALRAKVDEGIVAKLGKAYPDMFESGVDTVTKSLLSGFVEFRPASKGYWIRVGSKGVLASRERDFFSRRDVFHPPMKAESIRSTFNRIIGAEAPQIAESLEDAVFEAIYG